jgi:hypothetical protein
MHMGAGTKKREFTIPHRQGRFMLDDGGNDDYKLRNLVERPMRSSIKHTSSHSAPAVESAIRVEGTRRRAAIIAV